MSFGSDAEKISPYLPGLGGPLFILLLVLFLFFRPLLLLGDGGSCRHFLTGLYLLEHAKLPQSTYMSFAEPGAPWTTHELLCDLLFGLPFPALGLNWVLLSSAFAIALGFCWSYQIARRRGAPPLLALLAFLLVFEICSIHWSARPHLFTYLLFLAAYFETFIQERKFKARLLVFSIIFFLWGNLHGSFMLALIMILCRTIADLLENKFCSHEGSDRWSLKESLVLLSATLVAASLNLRGLGFLSYVLGYITNPKIQANSDEWRSFDFSFPGPAFSYLLLFCLLVFLWVFSRVRPRLREFLYMLFLFCSGIYAMRLIPYFALAALPAMAAQLSEIAGRPNIKNAGLAGKLPAIDASADRQERAFGGKSLVFVALSCALALIFLFAPACKIADFDPSRLPVKAIDYMKEKQIGGRGFCKDNWGAYLYWRLGQPFFIDDKTDFYSQSLLDDYSSIYFGAPGWQKVFARYSFDYVLIPRGLPLELALNQDSLWKRLYQDNVSVLFVRQKQAQN